MPTVISALEDELSEVQQKLRAAVDALGSPLGDIVRSQARRSVPLTRAAVVVATAVTAADDAGQRGRRITLAAALEMLHVALNVHRLLIAAPAPPSGDDRDDLLNRSFVGSAILSGDYCFSRAAQFAAATDNPRVAALFAHALQVVSEGQLRRQFVRSAPESQVDYDETGELLRSGVLAAAALVDAPAEEEHTLVRLSQELAKQLSTHQPFALAETGLLNELAPARATRWQALPRWLAAQAVNGRLSSTSSPLLR